MNAPWVHYCPAVRFKSHITKIKCATAAHICKPVKFNPLQARQTFQFKKKDILYLRLYCNEYDTKYQE